MLSAEVFQLAGYNVSVRSVAGVETCVFFRGSGLNIAFDMGCHLSGVTACSKVFITHGHLDHCGAVHLHAAQRVMRGMSPPSVYLPPCNVSSMRAALEAYGSLDDNEIKCELVGADESAEIPLTKQLFVRPFPTRHRVPSQGYVVWRRRSKLKDEFVGRKDIAELKRAGVEVTREVETPEIAVTGDTTLDAIEACDAARSARLLVMECTGLDDALPRSKTHERGHIHLDDIVEKAHIFNNEAILLMHFSARYKAAEIEDILRRRLPPSLRGRVAAATAALEPAGRVQPRGVLCPPAAASTKSGGARRQGARADACGDEAKTGGQGGSRVTRGEQAAGAQASAGPEKTNVSRTTTCTSHGPAASAAPVAGASDGGGAGAGGDGSAPAAAPCPA